MRIDFKLLVILASLLASIMFSDDDEYSLSGLTQSDPEYKQVARSSDEESVDNFQALLESARRLAGGEINDFGDSVFQLSQVEKPLEKPSELLSSAISIGTEEFQINSNGMTNKEAINDSDVEVGLDFLTYRQVC